MKLWKIRLIFAKVLRIGLNRPALNDCEIDKKSKVCEGTQATRVKMGKYSYIGCFCFLVNTEIGKFCSIADNCRIGGAEHPLNRLSMSPVFHDGKNVLGTNFNNISAVPTIETIIGNDVWIGANCCIKSGVSIADGAVVGMGSIVVHDIGPYEIWAGNPAKLIRKRFDDDTIDRLLHTQWWELDDSEIGKFAEYIDDVEKVIECIEGK